MIIQKKPSNRKVMEVDMSYLKHLNERSYDIAFNAKKNVAEKIRVCLSTRFSDYNDTIFESMKWFDPIYWEPGNDYALNDFTQLLDKFHEPLQNSGYNQHKVIKEWLSFRKFVALKLPNCSARELWRKTLNLKKNEYPNLCILAELVIVFSGSNSTVERSFNVLRNMLPDKRLSLHHDTMNMLLQIHLNDKLWTNKEREDILLRALAIYEEKRRCKQLDSYSLSTKHVNDESESYIEVLSDDDYTSSSDDE